MTGSDTRHLLCNQFGRRAEGVARLDQRAVISQPFLEPPRLAERALIVVVQEAYNQGILTCSVDDLVKAMEMSSILKSQVSPLSEEIDVRVKAFLKHSIEGDWPYVWVDAKRILKLDRLRLRGPNGAQGEFLLAATAQNLRKRGRHRQPVY